jgi:hypothetical protein
VVHWTNWHVDREPLGTSGLKEGATGAGEIEQWKNVTNRHIWGWGGRNGFIVKKTTQN